MWNKLIINDNLIKVTTEKSALIACSKKGDYAGFCFWHPIKLVREEFDFYFSISYTNDFEFKLIKYGKGKYNKRTVIEKITIKGEDIKSAFRETKRYSEDDERYYRVTEPKAIEIEVNVPACLKIN